MKYLFTNNLKVWVDSSWKQETDQLIINRMQLNQNDFQFPRHFATDITDEQRVQMVHSAHRCSSRPLLWDKRQHLRLHLKYISVDDSHCPIQVEKTIRWVQALSFKEHFQMNLCSCGCCLLVLLSWPKLPRTLKDWHTLHLVSTFHTRV